MAIDMSEHEIIRGGAENPLVSLGLMEDCGRTADVARGERQLGPFVLPPFQRAAVWTPEQKTRLVESLWMGLPIAAYVYNTTNTLRAPDMWLIDGQQRWTAIREYVAGEVEAFGYRFHELGQLDQRQFRTKPFPSIRMQTTDMALLRDVYERLVYGGTPHEPVEEPAAPSLR